MDKYYLIGDISATNSNLALIKNEKIIFKKRFLTSNFNSLSNMIKDFLKGKNYNIEKVAFGFAGPITKKLKLSQNKIKIDKIKISNFLKTKEIYFINDFVGLSYLFYSFKKEDLIILNKGKKSISNVLFVGAGTGFGVSYLKFLKKNYKIYGTEFHKLKFDLEDEKEIGEYLKKLYNKRIITYGHILNGEGVERIYSYFRETKYTNFPKNLSAKKISKTKKTNNCSYDTFKLFFKLYAKAIRQLIIKKKCYGGVYIAGGIIQKNLDFNKKDFLYEIFKNNLKLKNTPINIIKDYDKSLEGLKNYIFKKI